MIKDGSFHGAVLPVMTPLKEEFSWRPVSLVGVSWPGSLPLTCISSLSTAHSWGSALYVS